MVTPTDPRDPRDVEIAKLRAELALVRRGSRGRTVVVACDVCGRTCTKLVKYVNENQRKGRAVCCDKICSAKLGGRKSGEARAADPAKRHHLGGQHRRASKDNLWSVTAKVKKGPPKSASPEQIAAWIRRELALTKRHLAGIMKGKRR